MKRPRIAWRVVLVRPRNPLNIGAAARACANFGVRDLVLLAPHPPVWEEARSAVGAEDVLKSARVAATLAEAVGECSLAIGTTAGTRRNLDRDLVPLDDLAVRLRRHAARHRKAALVFGSEKTGLSNDDLAACHLLVRIPTSVETPSMNLGQAVAVCCYELARAGLVATRPPKARIHLSDPANLQSLEHLFNRAARLLDAAGYLKPKSRAATLRKLRRLLLDLELTNNDARVLGGVLAQVEWKLNLDNENLQTKTAAGRHG
jgi:tRNA/rRNA methyltransferase